ncbi:hypothetical protein SRHO_G00309520 [Serrasalmus rhombeus]
MQILEPMLPHTQTLSDESNSRYCVSALANVYCQKVGGSVTQTYLGELKRVAKLSGKDFEEMLKEALAQIGESVEASELADQKLSPEQSKEYRQLGSSPLLLLDIPREPESYKTDTTPLIIPPLSPVQKVIPSLDPGAINPPEVQKLVVEHIVRSEEKSSYAHLSLRLRTFSGKNPRPYSEADYDTWRSHVDLMMNDPSVSEIEKTRKIIESLLAPATDVIRHLGPEASPTCYLQLLDSAFGLVEDGEELFARFMNTLQNMGEKPSAYLQRLQLALSLAVRAGGVSADNADKHLLKQFCRGCWENSLLVDLQLECKRDSPPPFAELLLLLRTAEDKQEAKTLRMKQHLGAVKHKASLHQHSACECDETHTNSTQEVEGANGQSVPYLGYVELSVVFPKEFTGIEVEVPTLALVVPGTTSESQPHVLIGTNTLDVLYETASETAAATPESPLYGYRAVLKILELRQCHHQGSAFGFVKLHDKTPQLISAGQFVVVNGCAVVKEYTNETKAILEHPTWSSLPGGLLVQPCLIDVPSQPPYKVSVMLKNESARDIVLPPKCILAELSVIQTVLSPQQSVNTEEVNSDEKPKLSFNFGDSPVSAEWKDRITKKLNSMPEVFAQSDIDFGRTDRVKHHIKLSDETPFKHRARPIHPHDLDAVRRHLQELLQAGIIRESESPFSSPIVVVRKKNGEVRLCVDYRKLNLQTVKDAYALPNLEETFSALTGSKWFTVLDLKSGYYQIEVEEADKPKTAFVCPLGFWEFNRMAQGVTNAPSTFQRLMEKCVGDMNLREVVVFLDDVIVFSNIGRT